MGDSFQGVADIIIQPGTTSAPYTFTFAACSSATANDGSIPYGTTISSVAVKAFNEEGTDKTTEMVVSSSTTTTVVSVSLKYPTSGSGRYSLEIVLTLNSGATLEYDFTRVFVKDITA